MRIVIAVDSATKTYKYLNNYNCFCFCFCLTFLDALERLTDEAFMSFKGMCGWR